jgi:hypothetical protein
MRITKLRFHVDVSQTLLGIVGRLEVMSGSTSGLVGTWHLDSNGFPIVLVVTKDQGGNLTGHIIDENGHENPVDNITQGSNEGDYNFRRVGLGFWQWYVLRVARAVCSGRFSHDTQNPVVSPLQEYRYHVRGWSVDDIDRGEIVPRVWDVVANNAYLCTLRIDRADRGDGYVGRWKCYARNDRPGQLGSWGEEDEYDLVDVRWDGKSLSFRRVDPSWGFQTYSGTVSGRTIKGTFTQSGQQGEFSWSGTRSNVLTYGLREKSAAERNQWQADTRARLECLIMAGNPAPIRSTVQKGSTRSAQPDGPLYPIPGYSNINRDDNPAAHSQDYSETEFHLSFAISDLWSPLVAPVERSVHCWLTVPVGAAPVGGYPVLLAVNGHPGPKGSGAYRMLDPTDGDYWYGDAWARRGYVVLAVDISHRPPSDSVPLYTDFPNGNDPNEGNGPHSAICSSLYPHDADFEEDGERAWDAMRALDVLIRGELGVHVNPSRVAVSGLSLGGEMTTWIGALDARVSTVVPAGFSPDLNVMSRNGNHPCWKWRHSEVREYVDTSDLHALVAPRLFVIQTGIQDRTYSVFHNPPFASDKQVARRARTAWFDHPARYVHYLQPYNPGELPHQYRVGDVVSTHPGLGRQGVQVPVHVAPANETDRSWQNDPKTEPVNIPGLDRPSLFDLVDRL